MSFIFGDSFDCYAAVADLSAGYWDSITAGALSLQAGRFAGSQALQFSSASTTNLTKSSAVNDAVHHISVAYRQTATLSGTTAGLYFQFIDNVTNQCCIVFRPDGTILLTSATPVGTTLATYSGAVTAANTWFQFEFEVIISNTVGRFRARKNGNTSDDFDSGAVLNTRPGANSYANKLFIAESTTVLAVQIDDLLWRSDTASVAWIGDTRSYTRMPASDAAAQFAKSPTTITQVLSNNVSFGSVIADRGSAAQFVASISGVMSGGTFSVNANATAHVKLALYDSTRTTLLATSTEITNPTTGTVSFVFPTPPAIIRGQTYILTINQDASVTYNVASTANTMLQSGVSYAGYPPANITTWPVPSVNSIPTMSVIYTPSNAGLVNETTQDGTTSYVYDATVNDADFYNIGTLASTPASVVAVTTRAFMAKSDAGARTGTVQIKSGATTVAAPTLSLSTSFLWAWRTDTTDPATGTTWTAAAVSASTIGPKVVA